MKEKTDVYDKYGQEISNGDIVDYNGEIGVVFFKNGRYKVLFAFSDGTHCKIEELTLYKMDVNNLRIAPKSVDIVNKLKN